MIIYIKMMIINQMIPSLICLFKIKINLAIDYTKVICIDFFLLLVNGQTPITSNYR